MKFNVAILIGLSLMAWGWQIGVEIEPLEARLSGGGWRISGREEAWHASGEKVLCEESECTVEYRELPGWQAPRPWHIKRPVSGDTILTVSYEKLTDRYAMMDFQLLIQGGGMERLLHLVAGIGCKTVYDQGEDVSIGMEYEEDAWLLCDGEALQWDCRPFAEEVCWKLGVRGSQLEATWDSKQLPDGCEMQLTGQGLAIDMRQRHGAKLAEGEYTIRALFPGLAQSEHAIRPGWNLIPCTLLLEEGYRRLLKDMRALSFDPATQSYVNWQGGESAFWLYSIADSTLLLKGWPNPPPKSESPGWNLVAVDSHTIIPGHCRAWEYSLGKYRETKELLPNHAYWLFTP